MWHNYQDLIKEDKSELLALEQRLRGQVTCERVRMLRFLKSGESRSMASVAPKLGYSARQLQRWWRVYREGGLSLMILVKPMGGKEDQVSEAAWSALEEKMKAGEIAGLAEAQRYLQEEWGIDYKSLSGISRLFARHQVKLKTGRRRHRKADAQEQSDFKK